MFFHFGQKFENSKWPPYVGRGKFFENAHIPCGSKILTKSLYLARLRKFVFCHFWQKFENLKWPPFLGRGKFFEIAKSTLLGYPVG